MSRRDQDAFPVAPWIPRGPGYQEPPGHGMSLRQYYAGQALAGLMAGETLMEPGRAVRLAVEYADALIAEESKENK